jgi:4-hydroxythreonine-4-phosphate dehydrogenase
MDKPLIGITIGDYNGIGPEVIMKTLMDARLLKFCTPVIYGNYKIFSRYKKLYNIPLEELQIHSFKQFSEINHKKINLKICWDEDYEIEPGKPTPQSGKAAFLSLQHATKDALDGHIAAIVTAPISKDNIQQEGFKFPGHTEYLADASKVKDNLMLMTSPIMRVALVTSHIAIQDVSKNLTKEKILLKINLLYQSLKKDFQIEKPKIAVLGLNEEKELLSPIIEELKQKNVLIFGPFPSDGFFGLHHYQKFDGVLAMYHDQGLIPFKSLCFDDGVNFTAGLPFVRTSPDHGTAFEIAGKNKASEESFRNALISALDILKNRQN